jgi:hypothetical protein
MKNYLLMLAMLLTGVAATAQQVEKGLTASNGVFIGFLEYKPADYNSNPNTKYPLIIFLHGIGERGNGTTQLQNVAGTAIPRYIKDGHTMTFTWNGKTETFLVLSPQLSPNYGWWQPFYVEEMINYAKKNMRIDTNRIILTGLSLGGGGVWSYAAGSLSNAKKLAAIAPVCGTCQNVTWSNIPNANLPTWAFHASDDGTVPVGCTNGAVTAINNVNGAVKAYSTIWPTGQHWIWDKAYDRQYNQQNPNIFEWFLAQNKSLAPNKRPVANAGPDLSTTTSAGGVILNASASSDQDGKIVRYVWRQVSGPRQVSLSASYSTSPTVAVSNMDKEGTYQFELKVVDERADWSTDLVNVTVTAGSGSTNPPAGTNPPVTNNPVEVKAGADFAVTFPVASITLDGSATKDPDGPVKAYEWTKLSGPLCTITSPKQAKTTVTNLSAGVYTFKLTAWGDDWVPKSDEIVVTVNAAPVEVNKAPVAIAGQDITITLPTNAVTLNGSASYDPDGSIASYAWSKISGPSQGTISGANSATASVSGLAQGTYTYRLRVTDNKGETSADTVSVIVKPQPASGNQPAVPDAGEDITITLPVNKTILDGSNSFDPDGDLKAYEWKQLSGPGQALITDGKSAIALASNLVAGTYKFELRVWGDDWVPKATTMTVTVKAPSGGGNVSPVASAGTPITISLPTNSATLNGSASFDIDGNIVSYQWSKVSGPAQFSISNSNAVTTTVNGLAQGTYKFCLKVTDNANAFSYDTITVQVNPQPANSPAVAKAGDDIHITLPTNSVTVDGSASYDVDGPLKAYEWKKISGPASHSIANSRSLKTTVSNLVEGTYKFELRVWGDDWVPKSDTIVITVSRATAVAGAISNTTLAVNAATAETLVAVTPEMKLYPSPATSVINLQYQDEYKGQASVVIYDMSGKIVSSMGINKDQSLFTRTIDVSNLVPGVYHVAVVSQGKRTLANFVKQ